MSFTLCNDFFVSGHAFSWRGGDEKSRWSERGGLLISVAVISEIGGLTAGAVRLSRQTVIHPHSKNIGIHASRNASLVRVLMSVSRKLCARSPSMGKREDSCEPWTRFLFEATSSVIPFGEISKLWEKFRKKRGIRGGRAR